MTSTAARRSRPSPSASQAGAPGEHVLVGYRLRDTIITDETVTRGLCEVGGDGYLSRIIEHKVQRLAEGGFEGAPLAGEGAGKARPSER